MVELNHDVKYISTSVLVKGGHGVVVGVHVTKSGSSNDKIVLHNGTSSSGVAEFTVNGETSQNIENINRRFENGIYAEITGSTARYLVIFK